MLLNSTNNITHRCIRDKNFSVTARLHSARVRSYKYEDKNCKRVNMHCTHSCRHSPNEIKTWTHSI